MKSVRNIMVRDGLGPCNRIAGECCQISLRKKKKWSLAVVCLRGGEPRRQVVQVHSIWCMAVKHSMRPCLVVERQVAGQSLLGRADGLVGLQIDLLVFDALPASPRNTLSRQQPVPSMLI